MVGLGGDAHWNRGTYYINNTKGSTCQKRINYWMGATNSINTVIHVLDKCSCSKYELMQLDPEIYTALYHVLPFTDR